MQPVAEPANRIGTEEWRKLVKLHVGCGDVYLESYINIDVPVEGESLVDHIQAREPDVRTYMHDLSMFDDESVDVIETYNTIEHAPFWNARKALAEFYRVLKPGGELVIECPDLKKCCFNYIQNRNFEKIGLYGIYGDGDYPIASMVHQYGYSPESMTKELEKVGFSRGCIFEIPARRWQQRDMRIVAFRSPMSLEEACARASERIVKDTVKLYRY